MLLKVKKIKYIDIFETLFFILPSVKPYVVRISSFDNIYDAWGFLVFAYMLFCFIISKRKYSVENKTIQYLLLFIGMYFISTFINGLSSIVSVLSESSRMLICPLYLYNSYCKENKRFGNCVHNIAFLYRIVLYIDCLSILINLKYNIFGSTIFSFLGMDNTAAFIVVPMLAVVLFDDIYRDGNIKLQSYFLFVLCFLCKVLTYSLTACLALLVFTMLLPLVIRFKIYIPVKKKLIRQLLDPKLMLSLIIIVLFGITFFNIQYLFSSIIIALGKDPNLGRVRIWQNVFHSILKNPLIGYGKVDADLFITLVGMSIWDMTCNHPHNSVLAVFFNCGAIGAFFFFKMLSVPFKKILIYKSKREIKILAIGMISFIVLMIADDYLFLPYIYVLISILSMYNYKYDDLILKMQAKKRKINI